MAPLLVPLLAPLLAPQLLAPTFGSTFVFGSARFWRSWGGAMKLIHNTHTQSDSFRVRPYRYLYISSDVRNINVCTKEVLILYLGTYTRRDGPHW